MLHGIKTIKDENKKKNEKRNCIRNYNNLMITFTNMLSHFTHAVFGVQTYTNGLNKLFHSYKQKQNPTQQNVTNERIVLSTNFSISCFQCQTKVAGQITKEGTHVGDIALVSTSISLTTSTFTIILYCCHLLFS